jgi:hypothetical protein
MEQHVIFTLSLIIEGTTEKVLQFEMSLKIAYNVQFGSIEQFYIFEHCRTVKTRKRFIKRHYFCHKTSALFTFLELPPKGLCLHYIKTRSSAVASFNNKTNYNNFNSRFLYFMLVKLAMTATSLL